MINEKANREISKFLSLVLRHQPETINIELDESGWTDVKTLIERSKNCGVIYDFEILKYVVETNEKKRFSFDDTFDRIRASQGHSVEIDLKFTSKIPPDVLYHGTATKNVDSILASGIEKQKRHHVHLSKDIETATKVGQRHGKVFVFQVDAKRMHSDNYKFFMSENKVWLTEYVPIQYITGT